MGGGKRLQVRDEVAVPATRQQGLASGFEYGQPFFL
jgi:hypothetical protein